MSKYGKATVGHGSNQERVIPFESYIRVFFDDRCCQSAKLEDGTYFFDVINHEESGRPNSNIWLSSESAVGIVTAFMFHLKAQGIDFQQMLDDFTNGQEFEYSFSDNLSPIK